MSLITKPPTFAEDQESSSVFLELEKRKASIFFRISILSPLFATTEKKSETEQPPKELYSDCRESSVGVGV